MKVITIGTDVKLFEKESAVRARQVEYAARMEELHIVVCTVGNAYYSERIGNLFLYPTHSKNKLHWVIDAYRLGKKVIVANTFARGKSVVSGQDTGECGLVAYFLSRTYRLPLQLQMHTDVFNPYFGHTFLNRTRVFLARFLIPRATGVRVVSNAIVASLHRHFPRMNTRISLLPIYVDIAGIEAQQPTRDLRKEFPQFNFILLVASRLTEEKHIDTAFHALQQVVRRYPRVGLVVAGTGPEESSLKNLARTLGIFNNVVFVGWQEDLISLYKTSNIFLLTSLYEGYGMSLIEAAACGCRIITTPVGVAQDIFIDGQNAFVCPVGDAHCFATRIAELVSDNAERVLFKMHIQDSIRALAVPREKYITDYVALLEKLL